MDKASVEIILANRAFLYGVVARGFVEEMDDDFASILRSDHARREMGIVDIDGTDALEERFEAVVEAVKARDACEKIAHEYVKIFVGPATLKADPWESVHLTGKRMLFQPNVLAVRESYREAGFASASERRVSDDFIGTECDFLAKLASRSLALFQKNDCEACKRDLERSRRFLNEHLLTWIDSLSKKIELHYPGAFYGAFTRFAVCVVRRDSAILDEILNS